MAGFLFSGSKPSSSDTQRVSCNSAALSLEQPIAHTGRLKAAALSLEQPIAHTGRLKADASSLEQPIAHTGRLKAAAIGARSLKLQIE
jgi:hypothetical protein